MSFRTTAKFALCSLGFLTAGAVLALGQAPESQPRGRFELASVRPTDPSVRDIQVKGEFTSGGRFVARHVVLRNLILQAYEIQLHELIGGPNWLGFDRFDIQASAEREASLAELRAMLRGLLEERFQLTVHRESKEMSIYTLERETTKRLNLQPSEKELEPSRIFVGRDRITGHNAAVFNIAAMLSRLAGRPVLDRTGLRGSYDFELPYDSTQVALPFGGEAFGPPPDPGAPSIFTAVRDLGLRLAARKEIVTVLVIDNVRHPSPN